MAIPLNTLADSLGINYASFVKKGYKLSYDTIIRRSEYLDEINDLVVNNEELRNNYYRNLKPGNELSYLDFNCFTNAAYNMENAYRSHTLNFVVGSLGIGVKPFWEYGHVKYKDYEDFDCQNTYDAHAWLEDKHGNVFDFVYPSFVSIAHIHNRQIKLKKGTVIEGKSKSYLAKKGLHYISAPDNIRDKLAKAVMYDAQCNLSQVREWQSHAMATK